MNKTEKLRQLWDNFPTLHSFYDNNFEKFLEAQKAGEKRAFGNGRPKGDVNVELPAGAHLNMDSQARSATSARDLQLRAEFDRDRSLQEEFCGDFELFKMYRTEIPGIVVKSTTGKGCSRESISWGEKK